MKQQRNGSRLEETTALLQQAMATLLQNQTLFVSRVEKLGDKIDQKFADIDRRFTEIDRRFEHIEALLLQKFAEMPEKVFGFGQTAAEKRSKTWRYPIVPRRDGDVQASGKGIRHQG